MSHPPALLSPQPGPGTLKEVRWGGCRLSALRGGPEHAGRSIGESWEFSTLTGHESRSLNKPLSELLGGPLPVLVKLIDTALPLSIQVHPTDDFTPGQPGKEEAWIVLDAEPGARLLAGVRPGVDASSLRAAVEQAVAHPDQDSALMDSLASVDVRPGTCVLVPAGTIHAIGPGIMLAEIQQPVDRTFRLFDYGSGRPLHVEQALQATHIQRQPLVWQPEQPPTSLSGQHIVLETLTHDATRSAGASPNVWVGVQGQTQLRGPDGSVPLRPGDLVLHTRDDVHIEFDGDGLVVLGYAHGEDVAR